MGVTMYHGTSGIMELFALVGVGSGLYNGEEWPKSFNEPLKSTSLNEFWGKRYHQLMRVSDVLHLNMRTDDRACS